MFAKDFWEDVAVPDNNDDLARAVRDWIDQHGLTQAKISARGGPSSTTLTKITKGEGSFRAAIFDQLDRGLGWGSGRAQDIWKGEPEGSRIDWREASDDQLLEEVRRRLQERRGVESDAKKSVSTVGDETGALPESAVAEGESAARSRRVEPLGLSRDRD